MTRMKGGIWRCGMLVVGVAAGLLGLAVRTHAQGTGGADSPTTAGPLWGEVTVEFKALGVGDSAKPGDWTGIELALTDSAAAQREAIVRIWFRDADRDVVEYERVVALDPGRALPLWVYARLPGWMRTGDLVSIDVFEAVENNGADAAVFPVRAGRLIGQARVPARRLIDRSRGMIGVLGGRSMSLNDLTGQTMQGQPIATLAHESVEVVTGLTPETLPDRPQGLASFSTIVWTDAPPGRLGLERASALRDWVHAGGHLVVVLPRAGQSWTDEVNNPLFDLTPRVRVERRENVDLRAYWRLLSPQQRPKDAQAVTVPGPMLPPPSKQVVQTLTPLAESQVGEADIVLVGPDGAGLVARRAIGTGAVTLIGLDLTNAAMANAGLPAADVFWPRVLGTRGEYPNAAEAREMSVFGRESVTLDRGLSAEIAKTGRSAAGVLLGFVVFVMYWLIAGPVGFGLLKLKGLLRHSWVAFLACAGVFTAIAWGGASMLRPRRAEASHLSIIQHVYGQNVQRARGWFNLLLPRYGDTQVRVAANADGDAGRGIGQSTISPWESLGTTGPDAGFPDARGYRINGVNPVALFAPSRATVKQFQIDWVGENVWKMPRPGEDPVSKEPDPVRLVLDQAGRPRAAGHLLHELPGPLEDLTIIVCRGQASVLGQRGRTPIVSTSAFKLADPWKPGVTLDLAAATSATPGVAYFDSLLESFANDGMDADTADSALIGRLTAAMVIGQLTPPADTRDQTNKDQVVARRTMTHGWDVSRWFTQPCVLMIGAVSDSKAAPSPIPISLGGASTPVATHGRTLVVWVYPLPSSPPGWPTDVEEPTPPQAPSLDGVEKPR